MPEPFFKSPWKEDERAPKKPELAPNFGVMKKTHVSLPLLPIGIGLGAILVIGLGIFLLMQLISEPAQSASVVLMAPSEVPVGQPFSLKVKIENTNTEVLKNGTLSIYLPPEMAFTERKPSARVYEESIGTIDRLSFASSEVQIGAASGTEKVGRIQAKFTYVQSGSSAQFERNETTDVLIGQPAVTLDLSTPETILSGGNFETKITINNRTSEMIGNLTLSLAFPKNFILSGTSESSTTATSSWPIGVLESGEVRTVTITGNLIGQESDFVNLVARLTRREGASEYILTTKSASLSIAAPPLSLTIRPSNNDAARLGEKIDYLVSIKNNTEVPLENVVLKATLLGELFNMSTLQTSGVLNAINNTVTWNSGTIPSLLRLPPGESQTIGFSIFVKNSFPIARQSDKNYVLKVNGSAESPTPIPSVSRQKTFVQTKSETKVAGEIGLRARGYHEGGPYPPKVNASSRYTIRWTLQNYAADVSRIEISSFLEPYSQLIGKPTANISSTPIYNSASGQISWKIDKLAANQGVLGAPIEAVFQIESTPSSAYVDHDMTLLRPTILRANDDFIGRAYSVTAGAILSSLPDDQSLGNVDRTVQP